MENNVYNLNGYDLLCFILFFSFLLYICIEYHDNSKIYPNTSVLVSRVPVARGNVQAPKSITSKITKSTIPGLSTGIPGLEGKDSFGDDIFSGVKAPPKQTEEDRLTALINSTNTEYALDKPLNAQRTSGKVPPSQYVCHRCGKSGHFIQDCPTNGDPNFNIKKVKRANGIPTSFLQKVDPTLAGEKGIMVLPGGQVAVMRPNEAGFVKEVESSIQIVEIPSTLKCPLCKGLFRNAVLTPCCGRSFCETCITTHLLEKSKSTCPNCQKKLSVKSLVPNVSLNENVLAFRNKNPNVSDNREESNIQKSPKNEEPTKEELIAKEKKENEIRAKSHQNRENITDRKRKDRKQIDRIEKFDRMRVEREKTQIERTKQSPNGYTPQDVTKDRYSNEGIAKKDLSPQIRERSPIYSRNSRYSRDSKDTRESIDYRDRHDSPRKYRDLSPRGNESPNQRNYRSYRERDYDDYRERDYRESDYYRERDYGDYRYHRDSDYHREPDYYRDRDYDDYRNSRDYKDDYRRDDRDYDKYSKERSPPHSDHGAEPRRGSISPPRDLSPRDSREYRDRGSPKRDSYERDLEYRIINKERPLQAVGVLQGRKNINLSELEKSNSNTRKERRKKSRRR